MKNLVTSRTKEHESPVTIVKLEVQNENVCACVNNLLLCICVCVAVHVCGCIFHIISAEYLSVYYES